MVRATRAMNVSAGESIEPMRRLRRVEVTKLFGLFNHSIPLRDQDRITILFGINGIGKTIVLRMIHGLLSRDLRIFRRVPFQRFSLSFDDGATLSVEPSPQPVSKESPADRESEGAAERRPPLLLQFRNASGEVEYEKDVSGTRFEGPKARLLADRLDPYLPVSRVSPTRWRDPSGEVLTIDEVLERYAAHVPADIDFSDIEEKWPAEIREQIPSVRFIETQRLHDARPPPDPRFVRGVAPAAPTVARYATDLARSVERTLSTYATRSQELDRTFPSRLFKHNDTDNQSVEKLRAKLDELESRRRRLTSLGFLGPEQEQDPPPAYALENRRDVLTIYVEDAEKKLATLDRLAGRIELFKRIINERFAFKTLTIDRQKGFFFTQQQTGATLSPADLSSGEQHELVLLYDLLFKLKPHSLVLIDEPEISLHVSWQQTFMEDLAQVVQISDVDVVVATHAPELISKRWPAVVPMVAPNELLSPPPPSEPSRGGDGA